MAYAYKHGHVSQLYDLGDGRGLNGQNDCCEASTTRWLREAGFPWPGDDHSLIAHVRQRMTGQPEQSGQGYTSVAQLTGYLEAAGIPYRVDTTQQGILTPWTIALVRGMMLAPAQYPPAWFGYMNYPDHFILTLPDGWCNDPLAYANGQQDCQYAPNALVAAMESGICYHLPDPSTVVWSGGVAAIAPPAKLTGYVVKAAQMLRALPQVLPTVGPLVPVGTHVVLAGVQPPYGNMTTHWARVKAPTGATGWLLKSNADPIYSA